MNGTEGKATPEIVPETTRDTVPGTGEAAQGTRFSVGAATRDLLRETLRDGARDTIRDSTGDERVDAAMARLAETDNAPTAAHPKIFQDVHRRLQEALTGIDGEQA